MPIKFQELLDEVRELDSDQMADLLAKCADYFEQEARYGSCYPKPEKIRQLLVQATELVEECEGHSTVPAGSKKVNRD